MSERFVIDLWKVSSMVADADGEWQADCLNDHARGTTPEEAVSRLVTYVRAKRAREAPALGQARSVHDKTADDLKYGRGIATDSN